MLTLFLGAGFSKWAAGLPVATGLFDFAIEPWGPRDERRLRKVRLVKEKWDYIYPQGLAEQFIADALRSSQDIKRAVLWYIGRRLSEPFIWREFHAWKWRRHTFMIDDSRRPQFGFELLSRFVSPWRVAGIITTNYDLLVEYALGTKGFNYGIKGERLIGRGPYPVSQWLNPVALKGDIPVAKLHGSLSWDENGFYTDGRRGITGNALIVAPTREKKPPDNPMLREAWNLAGQILEKSKRVLVFGFAFNPYDEAVLNLLRVSGANIESVLLVNISGKKSRAQELWPQAEVEACLPPPEGSKIINEWFGSF
jgi:hypothetical protein